MEKLRTWKIIRSYGITRAGGEGPPNELLFSGVSHAVALAHVRNPEANSDTAKGIAAQARTKAHGSWKDSMEVET